MKKQKHPHLVGSKWTALEAYFGWRHFQVVNRKNQGALVFAELVAACDPSVRFWINAVALKKRQLWRAGWQSLAESQHSLPAESATHGAATTSQSSAQPGCSALLNFPEPLDSSEPQL